MAAREITTHHDGHGLSECAKILAHEPGPGGAPDHYSIVLTPANGAGGYVLEIQFQAGPRLDPNSTPGILENTLLAIVADRMEGFNKGPFACRENALVLTKLQEAMHWLKHRADERAKRGVLGKAEK